MKQLPDTHTKIDFALPKAQTLSAHRAAISAIQQAVCAHFRLPLDAMTCPSRWRRLAWPRQIAMHFCAVLLMVPLREIGEAFGGRDHGTVSHARDLVITQTMINSEVKAEVEACAVAVRAAIFSSIGPIRPPSDPPILREPFFPR